MCDIGTNYIKTIKATTLFVVFLFVHSWEQRKLGDYFIERNERSGDGEMISVTINSGIRKFDELNRHDTKPDDLSKYKRVEIGDIAYNSMRMWQGASGYSPYSGILSPAYTVITPKEGVSSRFFAYLIKRPKTIHLFEINSQGLTKDTWNLKFPAFAPIEVKAPVSYEEQVNIARILIQLDNIITLHQRKDFSHFSQILRRKKHSFLPISWEQRKFNELYEKVSEKNDLTYGTDEIISVANMYFKSDSFITDKEYLRTYNVFHLGDIAFEGNKSKNFAHGRFVENTIGDGIVSHVFDVFRPKIKYDLLFWKYAINNERLMGGILVRSTKASTMMTNLVANDFLRETILVPSLEEQKKIGSILENVDNLITLHQCESCKKVAAVQSAFARRNLSKWTDSWEQRKFNELYEKVSEKNDLTYGTDEIISVANMYFKSDSFITDKEYLRTYNVFHLGDIAFEGNKSKNFAHGRFVENTIGDGIVSHVFDVFRPKIKYDLLFWKYAINNERLMGGILVRSTKASTMMTNLVANDFLRETILVPSLEEQKKIGSILENVDNLITLHQRIKIFFTGDYHDKKNK